jgi:linoleate 10R-lipoxygenase
MQLSGFVGAVTSAFNKPKKTEHGDILKRLTALGYSHDHLANSILAILVGSTVELSIGILERIYLPG